MADVEGDKINQVLARAGLGSRRACERLVEAGRVRIAGRIAVVADRVPPGARVEVDGRVLPKPAALVCLLLNKPPGYVTTLHDPQGRPTVADLVADVGTRVYPVGRLDYDAEGLLLLTNDGDLTHGLLHPSHEVSRTYLVTVRGAPERRAVETLRRGVMLEDGMTAPARVKVLQNDPRHSLLQVEIHEGRNRQVKRMCMAVGHPVVRLQRTRMGPLSLGDLPLGAWRHLTDMERKRLLRAVGLGAARPRPH